jgi:hypothetical protein
MSWRCATRPARVRSWRRASEPEPVASGRGGDARLRAHAASATGNALSVSLRVAETNLPGELCVGPWVPRITFKTTRDATQPRQLS